MTARCQSTSPDDCALEERMIAIARERGRFGYRRLHVLLEREDHLANHKRLFRLYCEEKLTVLRRAGRKRAIGTRAPMLVPPDAVRWLLDFVSDRFTDRRRFWNLAFVDDCAREKLTLVAEPSLSGLLIVRQLDHVIAECGRPKTIVSDDGGEFTSKALQAWADQVRVGWHHIAPASRCRTASPKASTARTALVNARTDFHTTRPNSQLGWRRPKILHFTLTPRPALAPRHPTSTAPGHAGSPAPKDSTTAGNEFSAAQRNLGNVNGHATWAEPAL